MIIYIKCEEKSIFFILNLFYFLRFTTQEYVFDYNFLTYCIPFMNNSANTLIYNLIYTLSNSFISIMINIGQDYLIIGLSSSYRQLTVHY